MQDSIKNKMENFLTTQLKVDTNIKEANKIGEKIYVIKLDTFEKKVEVMIIKGKTKHLKDHKIYTNNDVTDNKRLVQRKIRGKAKEDIEKGNTVKIGYLPKIFKWNRKIKYQRWIDQKIMNYKRIQNANYELWKGNSGDGLARKRMK